MNLNNKQNNKHKKKINSQILKSMGINFLFKKKPGFNDNFVHSVPEIPKIINTSLVNIDKNLVNLVTSINISDSNVNIFHESSILTGGLNDSILTGGLDDVTKPNDGINLDSNVITRTINAGVENCEIRSKFADYGLISSAHTEQIRRGKTYNMSVADTGIVDAKKTMVKTIKSGNSEGILQDAEIRAANCQNLDELVEAVKNFNGCALKNTALNSVIYDGNPNARIMLIGEAPGAQEDQRGIPFCGQSGKLLDNILASISLDRSNIYITNTVFWRPPENRRPTAEELAICLPFVAKQIALIKPKVVILVGSTAAEALLGMTSAITKLRRQYFEFNHTFLDAPVACTIIFHPSYLLRQGVQKKDMWFDMLYIKKFLEN